MGQDKISSLVSIISFALIALIIFVTCSMQRETVEPSQVEAKFERDGRCFVQVWVEVTPEEYIGLDVGDEFEIK